MVTQDNDSAKDLGSLLQSVFHEKNWQDRMEIHQVFLFWDIVLGELASHAQPDIIRDNTLWVKVSDSVWMQQLQFEKQTIIEQINSELSRLSKKSREGTNSIPQINDIKFKLDPSFSLAKQNQTTQAQELESKTIDESRLKSFESTVKSINDENIEKSLKSLWIAIEQRKIKTDHN
nr:DUF721 domain-containing protein [Desulfobulbaceae bacterium]